MNEQELKDLHDRRENIHEGIRTLLASDDPRLRLRGYLIESGIYQEMRFGVLSPRQILLRYLYRFEAKQHGWSREVVDSAIEAGRQHVRESITLIDEQDRLQLN